MRDFKAPWVSANTFLVDFHLQTLNLLVVMKCRGSGWDTISSEEAPLIVWNKFQINRYD